MVRVTGSGYGLNTGEMGSVAGKVDSIKGHVTEAAQDVGKTTIEAKDFGRAHTQAGGPFTELLTGLSTMVTAEATAMEDYTKRMRDANSAYDASEWQNSANWSWMNARLVRVSRSSWACAAAISVGWRWPKFSAE